jgi:hypothetical protein
MANPLAFVPAYACTRRDGPVFTVPMMGKSLTFLIGPEAQAPFFKHKDDVLSQNEVRSTAMLCIAIFCLSAFPLR